MKKTMIYGWLAAYALLVPFTQAMEVQREGQQEETESESKKIQRQMLGKQLLDAVRNNNKDLIEELIQDGADPNYTEGAFEPSPLSLASETGNEALYDLLIELGAKEELYLEKQEADNLAAQLGNILGDDEEIEQAKEIIAKAKELKSINIFEYMDEFGTSLLLLAILEGNLKMVELLLQEGANPNFYNPKRHTPLGFIVQGRKVRGTNQIEYTQKHLNIVKMLLAAGANPLLKDGVIGKSPLSLIVSIIKSGNLTEESKEIANAIVAELEKVMVLPPPPPPLEEFKK